MNTKVKAAIFIGSGLAAGFGAGFFIGRRVAYIQAGKQIDEWAANQEAEIREFKDALMKEAKAGPYATVEGAADAIFQGGEVEEGGRHAALPDDVDIDSDEVTPDFAEDQPTDEDASVNVRALIDKVKNQSMTDIQGGVTYPGQTDDDYTYQDQLVANGDTDDTPEPSVPGFVTVRDPNGPYVISIDEYMEDDEAFSKVEMTYFEGDNVLVDSIEAIVPNVDAVIGLSNLNKWGQGTTDPEQVYIRNERLALDIELTRDDNTYTRVVLGVPSQEELERSMRKPLKMRSEDDGS